MVFSSVQGGLFQFNGNDFDFNLHFEQLFFSIIPCSVFILTSIWRAISGRRKPTVVNAPLFQLTKLGMITLYIVLELAVLILTALGSFKATSIFLAASVLKFVSALVMTTTSLVDHQKSRRPSMLLTSYIFLTLLLDAAQARTLFLSSHGPPDYTYSSVFCAALAVKLVVLLFEAQPKSRWLVDKGRQWSPEDTSGILSLSVYAWLNNLFLRGYKKVLDADDLYPLAGLLDSQSLHSKFSQHMDRMVLKGDKFGLLKVLLRSLTAPLLLPIFPRLALLGFTFCQPLFIEKLLDLLSKGPISADVGYGLIGASVLIYSGIAVAGALYWYLHHRARNMVKSILVTQIYLAATGARIGTGEDSASLTLMSTDIERIDMGLRTLHEIWASTVQAAVASWLLYDQIGIAFMAPIVIVVLCAVGLAVLMKFTGDSQRAWMKVVEKRVGLTATVIENMKSLKLSGLTATISDFVQRLRVDELAAGSRFRQVIIVAAILGFIPFLISPPLTFALAQHGLSVSTVYTSLAYLNLLTSPLIQLFQAMPQLASALACLGRIQAFLELEARYDFRDIIEDGKPMSEKPSGPGAFSQPSITIDDGSFGWTADHWVLQGVKVSIAKSCLTLVVGPVGSGKSTLSKALLGEVPYHEGQVNLSNDFAHVGFCDQTAYLFNGSIRGNIVGFSPFNKQYYDEVIRVTGLDKDFDALPQGDETSIGSNGIRLSGGQKQRVSLARALYLPSDLLIPDDVLSGLDAKTEDHVFREVFGPGGFLKRRRHTVVLCTHSVKHLLFADHIIALGNGGVVEQGSFDDLVARDGYVKGLRLKQELHQGSGMIKERDVTPSSCDTAPITSLKIQPLPKEVDLARQTGDVTVYKHYLKSIGWTLAAFSAFFAALWGFFTNFPTIWLTYWTEDGQAAYQSHSSAFYIGIYALLQICALLSLLFLGIAILILSIQRAGASLHEQALRTLVCAPLRFFTSTDTGVVTNLFSQDLNLIDTELPQSVLNLVLYIAECMGQAAVLATSSVYLLISYPFLAALLYVVQKFYLRTSRQLRLLDLEAKSPLYTHFLDTFKGIATLRSFGFLAEEREKNARLVDDSQRPAYLLLMTQQWLNLVLELVIMVMAATLTTLAVRLESRSGFTGAALISLMSFGDTLSGIVIFYTKLETSIGAVARLKTFNDKVDPEDREEEDVVPPLQWPQSGAIQLKNLSASYEVSTGQEKQNHNLALRDISLAIQPGEKIAICGRTGSGKSSLVSVLLKLLDPLPHDSTKVTIDNIPLHRIDRSALRQRLIAVPQEPVFLPEGTFAANLDPTLSSSPEDCESVLRIVGLWDFVQERGGLDQIMSAGTLSGGQRQLLSIGRAVLRRRIRARETGLAGARGEGGVLLLDEVSASADRETERKMQGIIRVEFERYTIVAVSHRLEMILEYDRVIVMDRGQIVEIGRPRELAEEEGTRFGDLLRASHR